MAEGGARSTRSDIALDRELVKRGGLLAFVRLAWHLVEANDFVDNWHIEEICTHLEAVTRCEIKRLIINVPPGSMKSLLVSVFWPVWSWIVEGKLKWMFASFDASLSRRDALRAKTLIEEPWFQERWGFDIVSDGSKANSATEFYNTDGGMRFSTSVAGKGTGWHGDIQVVDDPIKPKDTKGGSEATGVKLEAARVWWTGTMASRHANPDTFRRVIVMQRVHELDLTGVCLDGGGWVHLRLPMEFEADNPCRTQWGGDRRTVEGELLWPARFSAQTVANLKDPIIGLGPLDYAAQCQQRPMPRSGGIFQTVHFKNRWTVLPSDGLLWMQSWDMRFKDAGDSGDFVCGGVFAYKGVDIYLVKVYRGRWSFSQSIAKMIEADAAFPQATLKLVENKANGPAVVNVLKDSVQGLVLVEPEGGKEARANAVQPLIEAGNYWVPDDSLGEVWVPDYIDEMCVFPRGRFDDQVDMTTQALLRLRASTFFTFMQAMARLKANGTQ